MAKGLTPLRDLVLDGKRKQSHKNNAITKMNTMIYVKNSKGKNHGLSLRLGEGFTMMESLKGYKALGTPDYANFYHTQLKNSLQLNLESSTTLSILSREIRDTPLQVLDAWILLQSWIHLHKKKHAYL